MNRNENKLNSENGANYIHKVLGRVQSETILDVSSLGNVRWLQRFWKGWESKEEGGRKWWEKGGGGEDQRSEAGARLLLLLHGCLKLWWVDSGPTRDAAWTKDGDVQGPCLDQWNVESPTFPPAQKQKHLSTLGLSLQVSCRDLPSPILLICFQHLPVAESNRKLVSKELGSRFSKIPEQGGEEQPSGCTGQVNNQHDEK